MDNNEVEDLALAGMQRSAAGLYSSQRSKWRVQYGRGAVLPLTLGAVLLLNLVGISWLNSGRFVYTLDDPYIHLAFSEELHRFHVGLNAGESAAPSSSILWPMLLAPFAPFWFHEYLPLLINVLTAFATARVIQHLSSHAGSRGRSLTAEFALGLLVAAAFSNLVLMGMEHMLQVLCAIAAAYGLVLFHETNRAPAWWLPAVWLGPLLRYESAVITASVLLVLLYHRRFRMAAALALLTTVSLAAYSALLLHSGLQPLPSSVLVKLLNSQDTHVQAPVFKMIQHFIGVGRHAEIWLLILVMCCATYSLVRKGWRDPLSSLLLAMVCAIAGYMLAGNPYPRYILFLYAFILPLAFHSYGSTLSRLMQRMRPPVLAFLSVSIVGILAVVNIISLGILPLASNNIYEQQYQMHRFLREFHRAPVAVNDLGWASYRNQHYVLDLYGLGSETARQARAEGTPGWVDRLVQEKRVPLIILYQEWFRNEIPAHWTKVATLYLSRAKITPAHESVAFFVAAKEDVSSMVEKLDAFKLTLPPHVMLDIHLGLVPE